MRKQALVLFAILVAMILAPVALLAQDNVPDIYKRFLNAETVSAIGAVIALVELALNAVKLKGWKAFVFTMVMSLAVGIFQYGLGGDGVLNGLIVGAFAGGAFAFSKNFGVIIRVIFQPGSMTVATGYQEGSLKNAIDGTDSFMKKLATALGYLLARTKALPK